MSASGTLLLRADASARVGSGHLMRCLALAEAWQERGGATLFVSHCESRNIQERITSDGHGWHTLSHPYPASEDVASTLAIARENAASWIVIDGYHFAPDYFSTFRDGGFRVMGIDDMAHIPCYPVDLLLNQNLGAERMNYATPPETHRLFGPRYALLRAEFRSPCIGERETPKIANRILVTFGGSDPDNVTGNVVQALQTVRMPEMEVRILIGPANPHETALRTQIGMDTRFRLLKHVRNVAEQMRWADMAISAGGSTVWELCAMGVPGQLLLIAENQREIVQEMDRVGAAECLGDASDLASDALALHIQSLLTSRERREALRQRAQALVDGWGAHRVIDTLLG